MAKDIITYLPNVATKLKCELNFGSPDLNDTIFHMINTKTTKGNYPCPCTVPIDGVYTVFCPCKPWVKHVKSSEIKKGDKCHCELFVVV